MIRRRIPYDVLEREFNESLQTATDHFNYERSQNYDNTMTLERFVFRTISMMIDGIHYNIHSTMPEDSQWYDDVFNSLKDYYKRQIKHRYNQLSEV